MSDSCMVLCGGRCCEDFPISATPERIGYLYRDAVARVVANEPPYDWDLITIAEMVIRIDEPDEAAPRYTCRNLTPNGLCGIYNERPTMCSDYPGYGRGGSCHHCGITGPIALERRISARSSAL